MPAWYWFDVEIDRQVATDFAAALEEAARVVAQVNRDLGGAAVSASHDFRGASAETLAGTVDRTLTGGEQLHVDLMEAARRVEGRLQDGLGEQTRRQDLREADRLRERDTKLERGEA